MKTTGEASFYLHAHVCWSEDSRPPKVACVEHPELPHLMLTISDSDGHSVTIGGPNESAREFLRKLVEVAEATPTRSVAKAAEPVGQSGAEVRAELEQKIRDCPCTVNRGRYCGKCRLAQQAIDALGPVVAQEAVPL